MILLRISNLYKPFFLKKRFLYVNIINMVNKTNAISFILLIVKYTSIPHWKLCHVSNIFHATSEGDSSNKLEIGLYLKIKSECFHLYYDIEFSQALLEDVL